MTGSSHLKTHPVHQSVQFVKGIGPRKAELLTRYGIRTIYDLLFYVPRRHLDRSAVMSIADLKKGLHGSPLELSDGIPTDVTVVGEVRSFRIAGVGRKARLVLILADQTGSLQCVWFGGVQYWKRVFEIGDVLAVSGRPSFYGSILQIVHPALDRIGRRSSETEPDHLAVDWTKALHTGGLIPLYPSGQELERVGLDSAGFRRIISSVMATYLEGVPETLPGDLLDQHKLVQLTKAFRSVHFPQTEQEKGAGLRRLKYEEFFFFQLKLALQRHAMKVESGGISFNTESPLARTLADSLPYKLTAAQVRVVNEIAGDMRIPKPMNRLLQGDVGSGKTIVAMLSALVAVDNGYQVAFMAPTEILAEQHYRTLIQFLDRLGVNIRLLVGDRRVKVRREILEDVRRGSAQILVGTHAIFEEGVEFPKLGLVIIDEQHRFGVMQRAALRQKGTNPDVLVMTATPIPRTLSLTLYGDLDISIIDELPGGRKPITTLLKSDTDSTEVWTFVRDQVRKGRQAYVVYPLIEESEKVELKAATEHFDHLKDQVFPDLRLGLIHGRLPGDGKERVMGLFKSGEIDILVATTVIEVGIDVPNATVMVIENAERFGLAQLHQLRGRVGRGGEQSYCILIADRRVGAKGRGGSIDPIAGDGEPDIARRRLATMVETTDGFRIAEVDLELRGPGDFFGTRQSGVPEFKVANLLTDGRILNAARKDAFAIVEADPSLSLPAHEVLARHIRERYHEVLHLLSVA